MLKKKGQNQVVKILKTHFLLILYGKFIKRKKKREKRMTTLIKKAFLKTKHCIK